MSDRERTPVSLKRANPETAAVATREILGGFPDLIGSQLDLFPHDPSLSLSIRSRKVTPERSRTVATDWY
jgi:hypothetical protein